MSKLEVLTEGYTGFIRGRPEGVSNLVRVLVSEKQFKVLKGPTITFVRGNGDISPEQSESDYVLAEELTQVLGMRESKESRIERALLPFQKQKVLSALKGRKTVVFERYKS